MRKPKINALSEVERQFAEKQRFAPEIDFTAEPHWPSIRYELRRVAYHEAGHVAASMFLGHQDSHVTMVSVLPNDTTLGRVSYNRLPHPESLRNLPTALKWSNGFMSLIQVLAGIGAEMRVTDTHDRRKILDPKRWRKESKRDGYDFSYAKLASDAMASPGMPPYRIRALAAQWTNEMLDLPAVWRAVERFACLLCKRGTINDQEEIGYLFENVRWAWCNMPKWRSRMLLKYLSDITSLSA